MALFTVHFNEIALKGGNRYLFEDRLIGNISKSLSGKISGIYKAEKRVFFESADGDAQEAEVKGALSRVFGIEWYAKTYKAGKSAKEITDFILNSVGTPGFPGVAGKSMRVETKRGDKSLPFTSMELSRDIGAALVEKFNCSVSLKKPDLVIYVDILRGDRAFVYFEKIRGTGGLPMDSSGRFVSLLSGGIDSPVATWMIMKRGARAILLHVHAIRNNEELEKSKIMELAKSIAKWQNGARLYLADYSEFYKKTLSMPPKSELVLFKKFINLLAQEVARKEGALAIASGDSLGQVASQTMENLYSAGSGIELVFLRPLIGMDKREIITLAERIGTYEASIKEYKDCCSLVSVKNPDTRSDAGRILAIAEEIGLGEAVRKTLENARIIEIE